MKRSALLVLSLLLLAACSGPQDTGPREVTGTEGVVVTPLDNAVEVFENEEFTLTFQLENRGKHSIFEEAPGSYEVSYDRLYLDDSGGQSSFPDNSFWLDGRTQFQDGELAFVNVYMTAREIERFSQQVRTPVLFTACYPYKSIVTSEVCIEQSQRVDSGAIVCRNTAVRPNTPGAPIVVDEINVRTFRRSLLGSDTTVVVPQFRITVHNAGDGIPTLSQCDEEPVPDRLNRVRLRAWLLDEELDCDPGNTDLEGHGFARGRVNVVCTVPDDADLDLLGNTANFISLLTVEMDYVYRESARSDVVIIR